jgi:MoaA/NifB/PqqE/SkfB family radical SAM enzyme
VLSVSVELTNACPWRCQTCLPASAVARRDELSTAELTSVLGLLAGVDVAAVYYTGGEPLLRPDLPDILTAGAVLGLAQSFVTSGSGLTDELIDRLVELVVRVVVSLDGDTEQRHDAVRGAGSFALAVDTIDRLIDAGVSTSLSCTVTNRNVEHLDAIGGLALDRGVERITFSEVIRGGRARANWSTLRLSDARRTELVGWFDRTPTLAGELSVDDSCWVNGDSLHITSQGRLYNCSEIFQGGPRHARGVLRGEGADDERTLRAAMVGDFSSCPCRYQVRVRGPHVLVVDSGRPCAVLVALEAGNQAPLPLVSERR